MGQTDRRTDSIASLNALHFADVSVIKASAVYTSFSLDAEL